MRSRHNNRGSSNLNNLFRLATLLTIDSDGSGAWRTDRGNNRALNDGLRSTLGNNLSLNSLDRCLSNRTNGASHNTSDGAENDSNGARNRLGESCNGRVGVVHAQGSVTTNLRSGTLGTLRAEWLLLSCASKTNSGGTNDSTNTSSDDWSAGDNGCGTNYLGWCAENDGDGARNGLRKSCNSGIGVINAQSRIAPDLRGGATGAGWAEGNLSRSRNQTGL